MTPPLRDASHRMPSLDSTVVPEASAAAWTSRLLALGLGQEALRGGAEERTRLEGFWGEATLRELEALNAENDPVLYFESLLAVGRRLAQDDRLGPAQAIFSSVAELGAGPAPRAAARAGAELDAILGRGAWGGRAEFLARRFAREAASPSMLIGMTAASAVFQCSRLAILSRLTASPTLGFLSRGLGARTAAGLGAFALEAPAFALAARGTRLALGDPAAAPLSDEVFGSYLTLGGLKLFGGFGNAAVRYAGGGTVSRAVIPQFSTYLGIVAGHRLEQIAGLRPALGNDTLLADSLVTLLQFHVGGRLARDLAGPSVAAWQAHLELQSERLAAGFRDRGVSPPGKPLGLVWFGPAMDLAPAAAAETGGRALPTVMMMQSHGRRNGERAPVRGGEARRETPSERNAFQIVQDLVRCRERQRRRGSGERTLWQLMRQKLDSGAIPEARADEVHWGVYSRTLFENSSILRREFEKAASDKIETTVVRLNERREAIAKEQGQDGYSLATLVQALAFGGRIPYERMRQYLGAASALDFYLRTPALQGIGKAHFSDPYRLIRRLREVQPRIEDRRDRPYKISTLVDALRWHPEFPRTVLQTFVMVAAASDFVRALPLERLRIDPERLASLDIEQIYLRLLHLKPVMLGETGEAVSIGYVLAGLRTEGLDEVKGGSVNDTAVTNAHVLDHAYNRWAEWGGHFRNLAELPKRGEGTGSRSGWTRPRYSEKFLLRADGRPYSYNYASSLARWGEFLWQHREALELPTPNLVEIPQLPPTRRDRLLEFLEPHWSSLRTKTGVPEEFLQELAGLRREFLKSSEEREAVKENEPGGGLSLKMMVGAFFKAKGREPPRTLEVYAGQVDAILQRWHEWRDHLRSLNQQAEAIGHEAKRARYKMAEQHLLQPNGEAYSRSILGGLIRWGAWVWEHRSRLGLRSGDSTMPPPRRDGE